MKLDGSNEARLGSLVLGNGDCLIMFQVIQALILGLSFQEFKKGPKQFLGSGHKLDFLSPEAML